MAELIEPCAMSGGEGWLFERIGTTVFFEMCGGCRCDANNSREGSHPNDPVGILVKRGDFSRRETVFF